MGFKWVSRVLERSRVVAKVIQGCFKEISWVVQGRFRVFEGRLKGVLGGCQGCLKEFCAVFEGSFVLQFCCCMALIAAIRVVGISN